MEDKGPQTKVTEEAVFDAREIPQGFAALADGLSFLVRPTLRKDPRRSCVARLASRGRALAPDCYACVCSQRSVSLIFDLFAYA